MLCTMRLLLLILFIPTLIYSNTSLINAVRNEALEQTTLLLEKNPDLSKVDKKGYSALHYSILNEDKKIFDLLIDAGSSVNYKNSLLFISLKSNNYFTNVLLDKKIKINSFNDENQTPLIVAVKNGNDDIVERLLSLKPNISHKDIYGYRAIDYAFMNNSIDLAPGLYNKRWSNSTKNKIYEEAIQFHSIDALEFLLDRGFSANYKFKNGDSALISAIKNFQTDKFELLLNRGAKVDRVDSEGNTPLMHSIIMGNQVYVDFLLEYGANIHFTNKKGEDALTLALEKDNPDIDTIIALIDLGADIDLVSPSGKSALNLAAGRGFSDEIQYLIESNADINITDKSGDTPLTLAAKNGYLSISETLIKNGADINHLNTSFESPLSIAKESKNLDLKKLFILKGARGLSQNVLVKLSDSIKDEDYVTVRNSLKFGHESGHLSLDEFPLLKFAANSESDELIDILLKDKNTYKDLLIHSTKSDNLNVVKFLVNQGIDLTDKTVASQVLITAMESGSKKVFQYLLRNNISLDWVNNEGDSPVLIACEIGEVKMAMSLIEKGAKYDIENIKGYTALKVAEEKGYQILIEEMLYN